MVDRTISNRNSLIKRLKKKYGWSIQFFGDTEETWAIKGRAGLLLNYDEWVLYDLGLGEPLPVVNRGRYETRTTQTIMRSVKKIGGQNV